MTYFFETSTQLYEYMENHTYEVNEYIYEKIRDYIESKDDSGIITLFTYDYEGVIMDISVKVEPQNLINPLNECLWKFQDLE